MKYLPLLFLLWACSDEEPISKASLQSSLKFYQREKDSLMKMKGAEMQKMFEQEAFVAPERLATDTAYLSSQRKVNKIDSDLKEIYKRIEDTEEAIYKPE